MCSYWMCISQSYSAGRIHLTYLAEVRQIQHEIPPYARSHPLMHPSIDGLQI